MRRFALSVITACGFAALTACGSSGGYGFSTSSGNGSIDSVAFTNGSAQTNDFFVTGIGGTAPLEINALGIKGSGPTSVVVPDSTFTWAGRFVGPNDPFSVASYEVGPTPGAAHACPTPPNNGATPPVYTTPPVPIYQQNPASLSGLYPGYSAMPAGQQAQTVFVGAVAGVAPPYCLVIVATHVGDGVIGSKTVLVTNGTP